VGPRYNRGGTIGTQQYFSIGTIAGNQLPWETGRLSGRNWSLVSGREWHFEFETVDARNHSRQEHKPQAHKPKLYFRSSVRA
jgi:hypothetical protein